MRCSTVSLLCLFATLLTLALARDPFQTLLQIGLALVGTALVLDAVGRLAGHLADRRRIR